MFFIFISLIILYQSNYLILKILEFIRNTFRIILEFIIHFLINHRSIIIIQNTVKIKFLIQKYMSSY